MSLESKIEQLTAAIEALPAKIAEALAGATVAAPAAAEEPAKEPAKKAATTKKTPAKAETPATAEPAAEPDNAAAEKAKEDIVNLVRTYIGGMKHGSEEQLAAAGKFRAVFDSVGAAKAGDVPLDKAAEVLATLEKIKAGEAVEDGASSLI